MRRTPTRVWVGVGFTFALMCVIGLLAGGGSMLAAALYLGAPIQIELVSDTAPSSTTVTVTPASGTAFSTPPGTLNAVIVVNDANVRKGPGTNYGVLATYPKSTELVIKGRTSEGTWLVVLTPDGELGCISIRTVSVPIDVMEIEVYSP